VDRILYLLIIIFTFYSGIYAGEGIWIPLLVDSLNFSEMRKNGLQLSAEEIYSNNKASLKDAVVMFGGGCTGELISSEGLLLTNHHCGYSRIQAHSTIEKNYIADGFWAASKKDELPNPGLSVKLLVKIENVTSRVLQGITDSVPEKERNNLVIANILLIEDEVIKGTHYECEVKSFYFGLEYYLFIYEVYKDIRLVGAPPESIGRFGGDSDNWVWPRHTGDFALFRIYTGKDNKPAEYSPDNVPFHPRKYFSISLNGIREGDFTMIIGYPGHTDEYLTSQGLTMIAKKALPAKIAMRRVRLDALNEEMNTGPESRFRLASKYISLSNSWKKWIGVTKGVERLDAVNTKILQEGQFNKWAEDRIAENEQYATILGKFKNLYTDFEPVYLANDLGREILNSIELFKLACNLQADLYSLTDSSKSYRKSVLQKLRATGQQFYSSNPQVLDKMVLPELLKIYAENTSPQYQPAFYERIKNILKNDYQAYTADLFKRSVFNDSIRYRKLLQKCSSSILRKLESDPLVLLYNDFSSVLYEIYGFTDSLNIELNRLYRNYLSGRMLMETSHRFYPDANFTMRLTYGEVKGYIPSDAVNYSYYTTLTGIIEKENPEIEDYQVPRRLSELFKGRDYGNYAQDGKMPVCFIASNHTSGGNSGSPVLNANGELIGINFDRNWEGTVSDYVYDPAVCRNISLDIRYMLFIIDKFANASWLLDELTIADGQ
jgi:hypothetical protein